MTITGAPASAAPVGTSSGRRHTFRLLGAMLAGLVAAIAVIGGGIASVEAAAAGAWPAAIACLAVGLTLGGALSVVSLAVRPEGVIPEHAGTEILRPLGEALTGSVTVRVVPEGLRVEADGHTAEVGGWTPLGLTLRLDGRPVAVIRTVMFRGLRVYALDPDRTVTDVRMRYGRRIPLRFALPARLAGRDARRAAALAADGTLTTDGGTRTLLAAGAGVWRVDMSGADAGARTQLVLLALVPGLLELARRDEGAGA